MQLWAEEANAHLVNLRWDAILSNGCYCVAVGRQYTSLGRAGQLHKGSFPLRRYRMVKIRCSEVLHDLEAP